MGHWYLNKDSKLLLNGWGLFELRGVNLLLRKVPKLDKVLIAIIGTYSCLSVFGLVGGRGNLVIAGKLLSVDLIALCWSDELRQRADLSGEGIWQGKPIDFLEMCPFGIQDY
ncbi:MAG: hypothetical protein ABIV51_12215 [Saprospiraceae bacterium]